MNNDKQRKIDAYKKSIKKISGDSDADGTDDWLLQLAANDIIKNDFESEKKAEKEKLQESKDAAEKEQYAKFSFSEKAAAFAKLPQNKDNDKDNKGEKESKYRRVAKFLILIGQEQAAKVLVNLSEEQVEKISSEISTIRGISKEESVGIFAEFQGLLAQSYGPGGTSGGVEEARKLLYTAFGPEKGESYLKRAVPSAADTSFAFLEDFSGEQIAMILHDETPGAGALILSRIDAKAAAAALKFADPKWRLETVRRIGHIEQVSPEVLSKVAQSLRDKARKIGGGSATTSNVDGMGALAAILKNADISFGDKILKELGEDDPELSRNLKDRLYTLDDVATAEDRPIQDKLHGMSIQEVAILIKGRPDNFADKMLSNMSSGRRSEVRDEISFMGPITKKDSDAALKRFMDWFRAEREAGHILLASDDDLVV
ncbi:MAG: FliG C-terminal domain-containing protein [Termitinemataceae bacterium]|nr:MAG: FliG C-terminal domain-containing protein [Termitinemataceae bacterium]